MVASSFSFIGSFFKGFTKIIIFFRKATKSAKKFFVFFVALWDYFSLLLNTKAICAGRSPAVMLHLNLPCGLKQYNNPETE